MRISDWSSDVCSSDLLLLSLAWAPSGSAAPPETVTEQTLERINDFRQRNGLAPMRVEARLARSAQRHADDLAAHAFFDVRGSDGSSFAASGRRSAVGGAPCRDSVCNAVEISVV